MSFSLDNYTTVDQRIIQFYTDYPAGVITTQPAKIVQIGDATFVSVIARVWLDRQMESISTEAEAWELYPGKTPYTRDSEMMNAATSAIGRALMQLGIGVKPGALASRDEVQLAHERRTEEPRKWQGKYPTEGGDARKGAQPPSEGQIKMLWAISHKQGLHKETDVFPTLTYLLGYHVASMQDVFRGDIDKIKAFTEADWAAARLAAAGMDVKPVESGEGDMWGGTPW